VCAVVFIDSGGSLCQLTFADMCLLLNVEVLLTCTKEDVILASLCLSPGLIKQLRISFRKIFGQTKPLEETKIVLFISSDLWSCHSATYRHYVGLSCRHDGSLDVVSATMRVETNPRYTVASRMSHRKFIGQIAPAPLKLSTA